MFKTIDNIPNTYLYNDIAPLSLGSSTNAETKPKPTSVCSESFSSFSENNHEVKSAVIVENKLAGYDTLSSSDIYADAFDELGEPDINTIESEVLINGNTDNKKTLDTNEYKKNFITHIYVGSLSIIGLFALYRMIQKTR